MAANLFRNPYAGQAGVPAALNNDINLQGAAYSKAYNTPRWGSQHPILTGLLGLLAAGPAGAVALPMAAKNNEDARQLDVLKSWQEYQKNAIGNQNQLNPVIESSNRGTGLANLAGNAGYQSPLPSGSQIDATTFKNIMDGISAGDTASSAIKSQESAFSRGWNKGGNVYNSMQSKQNGQTPNLMMATGQPQTQQALPPLAGQISQSGAPPPLRPATYQNPDIVKAGVDNSATMFNNGIKAFPDYAELPSKIAERVANGDAAGALALLREAQTITEKQRPALIQAEAGANNALSSLRGRTDPNARGLNVIDLMTPAEQRQYAQTTAANGPGGRAPDYNPDQARLEFQLQSIINSPTDAQGNPISKEMKSAASMALSRLQSNNRSRSLPKGNSGAGGSMLTLPSGKKARI